MDKLPVRKAFAAALDRADYVNNILGGIGLPAEQLLPLVQAEMAVGAPGA